MSRRNTSLALTVALTLIAAIVLGIVPIPEMLRPFRPEWVLLVLIYWSMALPASVGIGIAWLTGLLMDVLEGSLLGQHALAYSVAVYLVLLAYRRIRVFPVPQQAVAIALLMVPGLALSRWVEGLSGRSPDSWLYWAPLLSSVLAWPLVYYLLRSLRRRASR